MKKSLFRIVSITSMSTMSAIALLSTNAYAQSSSSAQSNVSFYGVMDLGVSVDQGGVNGSSVRLTSGMATQSRWGFKGSEDLGNGDKAFFVIEGGLHADTGGSTQNGTLFGRNAFVGLSNAYGSLSLGLHDTPYFTTLNTIVDPLRNGIARSNNLMAPTGFRAGNSILLKSANFNGYSADLMLAAGEVAGDNQAGSAVGGSFGYSQGPWNIRLAFHVKNNDSASVKNLDKARNTLLGVNYDFGPAKVYFGYAVDKGLNSSPLNNTAASFGGLPPTASTDSTDLLLGVSIPAGAHTFVASYVHKDDKTKLNQDAQQYALAYMYALSKRTDIYTSYARISNHNGAAYTEGNSEEAGLGDKQFTVGLRHRF